MAAVHASINALTDTMENGFGQDKGEQSGNVVAWVGGKLATSSVGVRWESPGVLTSIHCAGCNFPRATRTSMWSGLVLVYTKASQGLDREVHGGC